MDKLIKYNRALEFICSMLKYCRHKHLYSSWHEEEIREGLDKNILDFTPSKKIKEWLKYIDENISPYFRNDFLFVNCEILGLSDVCFMEVLEKEIKEPMELINNLKAIDMNLLIEKLFFYYDVNIPFNSSDKILIDHISKSYSENMARNFIQIKKHPNEYKDRVISSFEQFYFKYYKPFESDIYKSMKEHLKTHNKLFKEDPISFVNSIGVGDYSTRIKKHDDIDLYISYFIDLGMFYYNINNKIIMCYGKTIKNKINKEKIINDYKTLFKALSDDKRIEILKLTAKRPWYNKELAEHFNLTTATLSYHLNLLLNIGVLNFEPSIINNRYYYTANKERLKEIFDSALNDLIY